MNTVGFPIGRKENEYRRALIPEDIKSIKNVERLYFEYGYGDVLGYSDEDYKKYGANFTTREEVLKKDIICDPKIGDAEYLDELKEQVIFGWIHAVQNKDITDKLIKSKLTAYAWEDMFEGGRHCFWHNNQMAGEAAVMHAFQCYGEMPYNTKVAILGRGNVATGAIKILTCLGADIMIYNKCNEELFKKELPNYNVIVNALLWDTNRRDHIIYKEDLKRMKKNSLIIDISCDKAGAIETSIPTPISDPIYIVDGIVHYVVDHTPSLFFKTASNGLSACCCKYLDFLIEGNDSDILKKALIIKQGNILDKRIIDFQNR